MEEKAMPRIIKTDETGGFFGGESEGNNAGREERHRRKYQPHKVYLAIDSVLGEDVLHMRTDGAYLAPCRRSDLADGLSFGQ